jgi:hypothetical protein
VKHIGFRTTSTVTALQASSVTATEIADGAVTNAKIDSVANTKISGNIVSSQITSVANTQITGNIASSQIAPTLSLYGTTSLGRDTTDYVNIVGGSGTARVDATGGNTDVNLSLATKGTGSTYFWRGGYGGTQMALINQYGLGLGATTPSSGTGIAFPATQSASSNANTLDDYEEGSWTPTDASGAGLSFSVSGAYYRKIGTLVFINCYFTYPATSNGNQAGFGNLPYTALGSQNYSYLMGRTQNNLGNMVAWQVNSGNNSTAANLGWNSVAAVTNANLSGGYILVSGCYIADN